MQSQENTLNLVSSFFSFFKQHQTDFTFLTVIVCFIFATVLLVPAYRNNFPELINQWAKPLGWTFIILGLIYLIKLIDRTYFLYSSELFFLDTQLFKITSKNLPSILTDMFSGFSNIFLVISASILQFKIKKSNSILLSLFESVWGKIFTVFVVLSVFVAVYSRVVTNSPELLKLIDHAISSFSLIFFGLILFRQLAFRRSHIFASVILFSTLFYGLIFVFRIYELLVNAHLLNANAVLGNKGDVNAFMVVFSLLLKAGLFFPAYYLITLAANELTGIRNLLATVAIDRREFLESDGILKNIKESLKADKVSLYIKLPGKKRSLISIYQNPPSERYKNDPHKRPDFTEEQEEKPNKNKQPYEIVFEKNATLTHKVTGFNDNMMPDGEESNINEKDSIIAEPIRYQGAVIGCLEARLTTKLFKFRFANTDVQQIQRIAVMLTRVLQANREMAGLDQLITGLGSLQTDKRPLIADETILGMLEIMDDIFNPLAIGLYTDIGFEPHLRSFISPKNSNKEYQQKLETKLVRKEPQMQEDFEDTISYITNNLIVPSKGDSNSDDRKFGRLTVAIPSKNDRPKKPTLFTYHLLCRLTANIISDAYLDFSRDYFSRHIKELTINLNSPSNTNLSTWFQIIRKEIVEVGLLWAVVGKEKHPDEFIGENKDVIKYLLENKKPDFEGDLISLYNIHEYSQELPKQPLSENHNSIVEDTQNSKETNHIIKVRLEEFDGSIWLGVGRKGFGSEIKIYETSPWKTFLERLAEISDSSLHKIIEKDEKELMRKEAAEFHELATAAVTFATLIHQIKNQVGELTTPITNLDDDLTLGRLRGQAESWARIRGLGESAQQIVELCKLLIGVVDVDNRNPCYLGEVVNESKRLLESGLKLKNIDLDIQFSQLEQKLELYIPFYVGSFAFTNLISNSIDAISNAGIVGGKICISVTEKDNRIFCRIIDNGPGIAEGLKTNLFQKGKTTKDGKGSGWGLYLTKRSLVENGATIRYIPKTSSTTTIFEVCFPKPMSD
jgi:signal transduction histidine kinase